MEKNLLVNFDEKTKFGNLVSALNSNVRQDILRALCEKSMSVKELAFTLNIPMSSASEHVKILENADLIRTFYQAGKRGSLKLCAIKYEKIYLDLVTSQDIKNVSRHVVDMPIGCYSVCDIKPTCGLVGKDGFIGQDDIVSTFYSPKRHETQLLWFKSGYIEYRFPNGPTAGKISNIAFSLECCSEAPGYRMDFPSDITFWLNNYEICTWKCPGDFGGRRGALTPSWWPVNSTQYGLLKTLSVTKNGSFMDSVCVSDINLDTLNLCANDYISLKIGIKEDSANVGGINIFGEQFGNHAQNILMTIEYDNC